MKIIILLITVLGISSIVYAQNRLTLEMALTNYFTKSPRYINIKDRYDIKKIEYDNFKKSLRPQVSISTDLNYLQSIQDIVYYDGSLVLRERNFFNPTLNLQTKQIIPYTGGEMLISSSLFANRDFVNMINSFSSNLINVTYNQSIIGFNSVKWSKKKISITQKLDIVNELRELSELKVEIAEMYLQAYLSEQRCRYLKEKIDECKFLIEQFKEKQDIGRVTNLQVTQLQVVLAERELEFWAEKEKSTIQRSRLKAILGLQVDFTLPENQDFNFSLELNEEEIIKYYEVFNFMEEKLKSTQLDEEINKITVDISPKLFFRIGTGINSMSRNFNNLYDAIRPRSEISFGIQTPLFDWGIAKNRRKILQIEMNVFQRASSNLREERKIDAKEFYLRIVSHRGVISHLERQIEMYKEIEEYYKEQIALGRSTLAEYKAHMLDFDGKILEYNTALYDSMTFKIMIECIKDTNKFLALYVD